MAVSIWTGEKADVAMTPNDRIRKLTDDAHALALVLGATQDEADSLVNGMKASYQAFSEEQARQQQVDDMVKDMIKSMTEDPEVLIGIPVRKFETLCRVLARGLTAKGWLRPTRHTGGTD